MVQPAERRATYEDLLAVPEHLVAEILDGELVTHPRPAGPHAIAASRLGASLSGRFDDGGPNGGGWVILDEPELHLHGNVLVPDIAGWRRERMPEVPDAAAFELVPDWACEILSPSTAVDDRVKKMRIYGGEGVRHVWLVDPVARLLESYRLDAPPRYTLLASWSGDDVIQAEPFEAHKLELARLWRR